MLKKHIKVLSRVALTLTLTVIGLHNAQADEWVTTGIPLYTQAEANNGCPGVCSNQNMVWNGQWDSGMPPEDPYGYCGCKNKQGNKAPTRKNK